MLRDQDIGLQARDLPVTQLLFATVKGFRAWREHFDNEAWVVFHFRSVVRFIASHEDIGMVARSIQRAYFHVKCVCQTG